MLELLTQLFGVFFAVVFMLLGGVYFFLLSTPKQVTDPLPLDKQTPHTASDRPGPYFVDYPLRGVFNTKYKQKLDDPVTVDADQMGFLGSLHALVDGVFSPPAHRPSAVVQLAPAEAPSQRLRFFPAEHLCELSESCEWLSEVSRWGLTVMFMAAQRSVEIASLRDAGMPLSDPLLSPYINKAPPEDPVPACNARPKVASEPGLINLIDPVSCPLAPLIQKKLREIVLKQRDSLKAQALDLRILRMQMSAEVFDLVHSKITRIETPPTALPYRPSPVLRCDATAEFVLEQSVRLAQEGKVPGLADTGLAQLHAQLSSFQPQPDVHQHGDLPETALLPRAAGTSEGTMTRSRSDASMARLASTLTSPTAQAAPLVMRRTIAITPRLPELRRGLLTQYWVKPAKASQDANEFFDRDFEPKRLTHRNPIFYNNNVGLSSSSMNNDDVAMAIGRSLRAETPPPPENYSTVAIGRALRPFLPPYIDLMGSLYLTFPLVWDDKQFNLVAEGEFPLLISRLLNQQLQIPCDLISIEGIIAVREIAITTEVSLRLSFGNCGQGTGTRQQQKGNKRAEHLTEFSAAETRYDHRLAPSGMPSCLAALPHHQLHGEKTSVSKKLNGQDTNEPHAQKARVNYESNYALKSSYLSHYNKSNPNPNHDNNNSNNNNDNHNHNHNANAELPADKHRPHFIGPILTCELTCLERPRIAMSIAASLGQGAVLEDDFDASKDSPNARGTDGPANRCPNDVGSSNNNDSEMLKSLATDMRSHRPRHSSGKLAQLIYYNLERFIARTFVYPNAIRLEIGRGIAAVPAALDNAVPRPAPSTPGPSAPGGGKFPIFHVSKVSLTDW